MEKDELVEKLFDQKWNYKNRDKIIKRLQENHYDIIIIGAGPAGLMAARELKKQNIKFLIIDSKKEIGLPLRCGEGIREKEFRA